MRYLRAQKEFEANFFFGMQEKLCSFDFRGLLVFCSTLCGLKSRITETFETENQQNHTFYRTFGMMVPGRSLDTKDPGNQRIRNRQFSPENLST